MLDSTHPSPQIAPRVNAWYEVAGVGVALIEASWMVLVFRALSEGSVEAPAALVFAYFALVFYLAYLMLRAFQALNLLPNASRALLLTAYAALTWLGIRTLLPGAAAGRFDALGTRLRGIGEVARLIPAQFWLGLALLWLVLRGLSAARQGVGTFSVQRHFKLGVFMFLTYSLLAFATERDLPGLGIFVVFLFATLLAMAAARVSVLGRLRGGRRSPFTRGWFGGMTAAVAGTVGIGFSLAMLATGRFLMFYRQLLLGALLAVVTMTLAPFIFVLGLFAGTPVNPVEAPPATPALPPWEQDPGFDLNLSETGAEQVDIIPPEYRAYYYWGLTALAVLIVISIFWGVRVARKRREHVEFTEYVYQRGDLLSRFRKEFEKRRAKLRESFLGLNPLGRAGQILAAARIRRIYVELIRLAASFGAPRDPAQTPLEFSAVLARRLPAARTDLSRITEAYLKIRYGELPEHAEDVRAVEKAWAGVKSAAATAVKQFQAQQQAERRERKHKEKMAR